MGVPQLRINGVHNVRQMDTHITEPLVPKLSHVKVEIAIGKFKRCKSLGTDQLPAELIIAGGETLCSEITQIYSFYME
jgi:hypothetical protein